MLVETFFLDAISHTPYLDLKQSTSPHTPFHSSYR
jgi:hypothetical protein